MLLKYRVLRVLSVGVLATSVYVVSFYIGLSSTAFNVEPVSRQIDSKTQEGMTGIVSGQASEGRTTENKSYKVLWYNPPPYVKHHPDALKAGFSQCPFSNCEMSFNKTERMTSDAVLFDGRFMRGRDTFNRSDGQVWIFWAHEAPVAYDGPSGAQWRKAPWRHSYNWTMTYNKFNTDIYLPYGILRKKTVPDKRNYTFIASKKTDSVIMISSHCHTQSKRQEYVKELSKYIPVTVLGACGTPWKCGTRYIHDNCFDLLNTTFKFYLSFENALCTQYFTEKFFENFNYDIILVVRGGNKNQTQDLFPNGTHISAQDFNSAKDLGKYLKTLSNSNAKYAKMLETKSMYYSPLYREVYQSAMCDLCKRMNFQVKYRQTIPDIGEWAFKNKPCAGL